MGEKIGRATEQYELEAAKCVVASMADVSLHCMRDAPDADLLHADGYHIGLEIVRAADGRARHLLARLAEATRNIEHALEQEKVLGEHTIYYDLDGMKSSLDEGTKREWDRTAPARISKLLKSHGSGDVTEDDLLAAHITCIANIHSARVPHMRVNYGWKIATAPGCTLAHIALESKNKKLSAYRGKNGDHFHQYWLAIASIGPGTVEDGGFSMLLNKNFGTDYDRVFLLCHGDNGQLTGSLDVTPGT